jgi:hemolysin activation/secretion protein
MHKVVGSHTAAIARGKSFCSKHSIRAIQLALTLTMFALWGIQPVSAQTIQRPDAGTLQEKQRQIPAVPPLGAPSISLPAPKKLAPEPTKLQIVPAAFRFEGNTVFDDMSLSSLLTHYVNKPTDLAGLTEAAGLVRKHYREQGYLLTEAYLPEQAFQVTGGTVTIAIIEARIGKVETIVVGDTGSESFARKVVVNNLKPGALITETLLDKPVLLLRDLARIDASANVEPGDQLGHVNVTVTIRAQGPKLDIALGADNHGARTADAVRLYADLKVSNLLGRGDVIDVRSQKTDGGRSALHRLGYSLPLDGAGTRLAIGAAHTEYVLGLQFAGLGATGTADVVNATLSWPMVRSRENNLYGLVSVEHKSLQDLIANPFNESEKQITATRFGLMGNSSVGAFGNAGYKSYALSTTLGHASLDGSSMTTDQSAGGLRTAGHYGKFNLELQAVGLLGKSSSLQTNLQAQLASKNLVSSEKMALGGPAGVRGYPVGEGIGDAGLLFTLEYRYQLPSAYALAGEPVSLATFYDVGTVKYNQNGGQAGSVNDITLGAVGIGIVAGRVRNFQLSTHLAWRVSKTLPSTGDPDRLPRAWVSMQKWF